MLLICSPGAEAKQNFWPGAEGGKTDTLRIIEDTVKPVMCR